MQHLISGHDYTMITLDVLQAYDACADIGMTYSVIVQCTDCVVFPISDVILLCFIADDNIISLKLVIILEELLRRHREQLCMQKTTSSIPKANDLQTKRYGFQKKWMSQITA